MSTRRTESEILSAKRSMQISTMYAVAKKVLIPFKQAITDIQINRVRKEGTLSEAEKIQEKVQQILFNELKKTINEDIKVATHMDDMPLKGEAYLISPTGSLFNLSMGLESICISMAYVKNGTIESAITLFPLREEFYIAEKGQGVDGPHFKLRASGKENIDNLVIGLFAPVTQKENEAHVINIYKKLRELGCHIRMAGNVIADTLLTSSGQYDAYIGMNLNPLDVFISQFYVRESAGFVCELKGEKVEAGSTEMLIANHKLQGKILKELASL